MRFPLNWQYTPSRPLPVSPIDLSSNHLFSQQRMAAGRQDSLTSPVGSFPSTASVSETIGDRWDDSGSAGPASPARYVDLAICGFGLRLPGGVRSGADYWDLLVNGRDARASVPASRYNVAGFSDDLGGKDGIRTRHGYFLDEELAALDTSLFSLTRNELERSDPQQRLLLEVVRECLEDAGETPAAYRGQLIGCYVGTFGDDWLLMSAKDAQAGGFQVTGHSDTMLANRVSHEYDFRGPR